MSRKGHLHIRDKKGITNIPYTIIVRIEAQRSYCIIYMENGAFFMIPKSMKTVVEIIGSENFAKPHRSHYVNLEKVEHVNKTKCIVNMNNGHIIPISKTEKAAFIEVFNRF